MHYLSALIILKENKFSFELLRFAVFNVLLFRFQFYLPALENSTEKSCLEIIPNI